MNARKYTFTSSNIVIEMVKNEYMVYLYPSIRFIKHRDVVGITQDGKELIFHNKSTHGI